MSSHRSGILVEYAQWGRSESTTALLCSIRSWSLGGWGVSDDRLCRTRLTDRVPRGTWAFCCRWPCKHHWVSWGRPFLCCGIFGRLTGMCEDRVWIRRGFWSCSETASRLFSISCSDSRSDSRTLTGWDGYRPAASPHFLEILLIADLTS